MIVIRKTLYSCCSGESDPIRIPGRRAAGWFGVDPPHLRWTRRVAVRCAGVGEGLAVVRVIPSSRGLRAIRHPGRSDLHLLVAVLASPQMPCERGHEACTHRGWPGGVGASGPSVHGMSREEQQGGPESTRSFRVRDGEWAPPDRGT